MPPLTPSCEKWLMQLFVALSEQSLHTRALLNVPALLSATSSYVVSATAIGAYASASTKELGTSSPAQLVTQSASVGSRKSATESAFRLLRNLASADGPRRRIIGLDGVVLAAARAVSYPASATAPVIDGADAAVYVGAAQAAAALLARLTPILGSEGSEEELLATGEAFSAAVGAVSAAVAAAGSGNDDDGRRSAPVAGNLVDLALEALSGLVVLSWSDASSLDAAAAVDGVVTDPRLAESVVSLWRRGVPEAMVGTGSQEYSPSPEFGTLPSVALSLLSSVAGRPAGRQALVGAGITSAIVHVTARPYRDPVGTDGVNDHHEVAPGASGLAAPTPDRTELIRILCVLCASPAHRAVVRASLVEGMAEALDASSNPIGGASSQGFSGSPRGVSGTRAVDGEEEDSRFSPSIVEAAIARLQGEPRSGGVSLFPHSYGCYSESRVAASRLALLLGVSPPPVPLLPRVSSQTRQRVTAVAAFTSATANVKYSSPPSASNGRRPPSATRSQPTPSYATMSNAVSASASASSFVAHGSGSGLGGGGSGHSPIVHEATLSTAAATASGFNALSSSTQPVLSRNYASAATGIPHVSTLITAAVAANAVTAAGAMQAEPPSQQPPAFIPSRSYSEENLDRLLSSMSTGDSAVGSNRSRAFGVVSDSATVVGGGSGEVAPASGWRNDLGVDATIPEHMRMFAHDGQTGGGGDDWMVGVDGAGGDIVGSGVDREGGGSNTVACKSCGRFVCTPSDFDLALVDCPHCQQAMG